MRLQIFVNLRTASLLNAIAEEHKKSMGSVVEYLLQFFYEQVDKQNKAQKEKEAAEEKEKIEKLNEVRKNLGTPITKDLKRSKVDLKGRGNVRKKGL